MKRKAKRLLTTNNQYNCRQAKEKNNMSITATATAKYEKAPAGLQQAVCVDVVDLGMVKSEKFGNEQHKIKIVWQLKEISDESNKRFLISRRFTLSLNEKSALRPFLESWRGLPFSVDDLTGGFDVEKLVGVNCFLQIFHTDDGKYANVVNVMPCPKGEELIEASNYTRSIYKENSEKNGNGQSPPEQEKPIDTSEIPF